MTVSQERIKAICEERKLPIYTVEAALKFSNGYLMHERAKEFPYDRLCKIAEYLNVPVEALTDAYNIDSSTLDLTADELSIISLFRAADNHDKATIRQILSRYKGDSDAV